MPEFTLRIDQVGADALDFQEYNKTRFRGYYLLRGNPAVRVVTRGGYIEDALGYTLPVLAGREQCWGQWPGNAHLKGRRTVIVTIFVGEVRAAADAETFSDWLKRHYLQCNGGQTDTPCPAALARLNNLTQRKLSTWRGTVSCDHCGGCGAVTSTPSIAGPMIRAARSRGGLSGQERRPPTGTTWTVNPIGGRSPAPAKGHAALSLYRGGLAWQPVPERNK